MARWGSDDEIKRKQDAADATYQRWLDAQDNLKKNRPGAVPTGGPAGKVNRAFEGGKKNTDNSGCLVLTIALSGGGLYVLVEAARVVLSVLAG